MGYLGRILLITFVESFATICVERGAYFYAEQQLGFSRSTNLWLALAFGAAYICGALTSHRLCVRFGEKRVILFAIAASLAAHLVLGLWPGPVVLFVCSTLLGAFNGLKWPVVESFISAGRTPTQAARAVGLFNISWAISIPLSLVAAGPLIGMSETLAGIVEPLTGSAPAPLFLFAGALNVMALAMCRPLPNRPEHLPHDHPDRPAEKHKLRLERIMTASRWGMVACYAMMWILAAVMPHIFDELGWKGAGPALSGVLDVMRLAAFVALWLWTGWHGSVGLLGFSLAALPVGFFLVLFAGNLPMALVGEMVFGLSMGTIYYAALYYAMVLKNASVDAGGTHESLIGLGFAIGPAAGLVGVAMVSVFGNEVYGMLSGIAPVLVVCLAAAGWSLIRAVAVNGARKV